MEKVSWADHMKNKKSVRKSKGREEYSKNSKKKEG
jgi:hypothetical protein